MNWTLEVVIVPVSDIDRSKEFYETKLGFNLDHDSIVGEGIRVVQLTPPGSGCSVVMGTAPGMDRMAPGSLHGLQLVVPDVRRAHEELKSRGVEVSEVQSFGAGGPGPAQPDEDLHNVGFVFFEDPDGNSWAVQQINRA